jgi:hypothetical protein
LKPYRYAVPLALAFALSLGAPAAVAREPDPRVAPPTVNAHTREAFAAAAGEVRAGMSAGGRFEYVTSDERQAVEEDLRRMALLFEHAPSVEAMGQDDKVALFNHQEAVNSILRKRDSDRMICKHERKTGSNIAVTECLTFGQREAMRRNSQKYMSDLQKGSPNRIE